MNKKFRSLQKKLTFAMLLAISAAIAVLTFLYLTDIHQLRGLIFTCAVVAAFIILLLFWLYIRKNVTRPIAIIIKSLQTGNTDILKTIQSDRLNDEWDIIVTLVKNDFEKTRILESQSQELEKKAQQLNEEIATKDRFFDLIAHDLRNPFNAIMGFSNVILEDYDHLKDDEKKTYLSHIHEASNQSFKLLEHLLEWARLQTGRLKVSPTTFDVSKTIDGIVAFHLADAIHRKVTLVSTLKGSHFVYADESMINVTIRNIVSNAIKFTQSGGIVMISAERQKDNLEIIVTDNGKGMSPDILNALFKIGEKVISEDMTNKKGTGLGLILCKEFVERNGGKIWVESELEKGSKFHFTIPAK